MVITCFRALTINQTCYGPFTPHQIVIIIIIIIIVIIIIIIIIIIMIIIIKIVGCFFLISPSILLLSTLKKCEQY